MKQNILKLLIGILALLIPFLINAQVHYVKVGGTGDGSSWANASGDLQAVINEAIAGDDIWIAEGTYLPTECLGGNCIDSTDFAFSFPFDSITLYGGFPNSGDPNSGDPNWADRDWDNHPTILSGNIGDPNSALDNVENVVRSLYILLDGVIVSDAKEVGIYSTGSNFQLTNCWVRNNQGDGGIYANGGYAQLTNCKISENQNFGIETSADMKLTNCQISNNQGRGIKGDAGDLELINCEVSNNQGTGVYCNECDVELTNCQVSMNQGNGISAYYGVLRMYYCKISNNVGIIASASNYDDDSFINFYNCTFEYNGGGLRSGQVRGENSLFVGNTTNQSGGAIYSYNYTKVKNCTFVNNSAENKGAAIYSSEEADITNCIFWGNSSTGTAKTIDCNPTDDNFISYSLTDEADCESLGNNITCGDGMIFNADDPFVSIFNEKFQLHETSQAINAGENYYISPTTKDLNGYPRLQSGVIDIGAYEYNDCSFYFTRQSQIDSFPINYPSLDTVVCDVFIQSGNENPITNVESFSQIKAIKGFLWIEKSNNLIDLAGLENLIEIGSFLHLEENQELSQIDSLYNLTTIGQHCKFINNTNLESIEGLENLSSIGGNLNFENNQSLSNLNGFNNLSDIGGDLSIQNNGNLNGISGFEQLYKIGDYLNIWNNDGLNYINSFEKLTEIGGHFSITHNDSLISLTGLDSLKIINGGLYLERNPVLTYLFELNNLDPSVLLNPLGTIKLIIEDNNSLATCDKPFVCAYIDLGEANIADNHPGCNSVTEIATDCLVGVPTLIDENTISIYPNPSTGIISIQVLQNLTNVELEVKDEIGKSIMKKELTKYNQIDLSGFPNGVYIFMIKTKNNLFTEKVILITP